MNTTITKFGSLAILLAGMMLWANSASAGVCPAIGFANDCNLLITINADLSISTSLPDPNAYDGVEDQLVGVLNNSSTTIGSLALSGSDIFGFDGDGAGEPGGGCVAASGAPNPCFPGGPFGPTGYEGPGTSFSVTDFNNGFVFFTGGLGAGQSIWFSLEEPAQVGGLTSIVPRGVPEPSSLLMLAFGLLGLGFMARRQRRN